MRMKIYRDIEQMSERQLYDLVEHYFDGCDKAIWPMNAFYSELSEYEQNEEIEKFKKNGIHFDPHDQYVGWIKGSSNHVKDLVDLDALVNAIMEDEDNWYNTFIRGRY